jgi:hypothetical protein
MKEIDATVKRLSIERCRLKNLLKKGDNLNASQDDDGLPNKECPCCGKFISKLCFRCEHLFCRVEDCPRKKKQVLNARMLEKMKKKGGDVPQPQQRGGRKRNQLQLKKERKEAQRAGDSDESIHSSYSVSSNESSEFNLSLE